MTCLNERIVGAIIFMLSGYAFADGIATDAPGTLTLANIAPTLPMEVVAAIPEPQRYVYRYEMAYQSRTPGAPETQFENFYSADVAHEYRFADAKAAAGSAPPGAAGQPAQAYLRMGPSTAPQLSIMQIPNSTLTLGAQPQRRLSLIVDDWVFSGTARVAVLHSHDTGATLTVRHGF
ncbi:MAG: hypothetical protein V4793_11580, partial [Paraburkholderia tropica]|uniref:Uncharacterized protein n=2 Tax=Burkholderiaceae TaxID=119060 RepID=A0A1A5X8W7_9BURK|nr:hypothetical protein A6456_23685 [Paraburkholderia tropica]PXX08290.1 hypothetical protein C7400_12764 [Paraburkholderia tropica]PZW73646.1 hypothetical protein C7399_12764 [Paraburkholderia tropica]RQN34499.1 hypothetical protein EHZ25_34280 [Paraburkholderia tropica]SEJ17977.1 hypothetical protein SAMN05216550_10363 [Paraburkholderia tropica]